MKKLALTLIFVFTSSSAFSQSFRVDKISESSNKGEIEVTTAKKALLIIEYQNERINLGTLSDNFTLSDIDLNLVQAYQVLKGESAITKYGNDAKNGVIVLQMKKNKAAKDLFEGFKKQIDDGEIDITPHAKVDERTGYGVEKIDKLDIGNSQDPVKTAENRPSFRSLNDPENSNEIRVSRLSPAAIFIMSMDGKERYIDSSLDINDLAKKGMESLKILKDDKSKAKYNRKGCHNHHFQA